MNNEVPVKANEENIEHMNSSSQENKLKTLVYNILKANKNFIQNKFSNIKNLENIGLEKSNVFEVNPPKLIFSNIKVGNSYFLDFIVTNISTRRSKIQFQQPYCKNITFQNITIANLAPGMSRRGRVIFNAESDEELTTELIIISEKIRFQLPIIVSKDEKIVELVYDPNLNLGSVPIGKTFSILKNFENHSSSEVCIKIGANPNIQLKDQNRGVTIESNNRKNIEFICNFQEVGKHELTIPLEIAGCSDNHQIIVNAKVSNPTLEVLNEENKNIDKLDFGNFFSGSVLKKRVYLKNMSDLPVKFEIKVIEGTKTDMDYNDCKFETPSEVGRSLLKKVVFFNTEKGTVYPNDSFPIEIELKTKRSENEKLIVSNFIISESIDKADEFHRQGQLEYEYLIIVTYDDLTKDPIHFNLSGVSQVPLINIGTPQLIFDDIFLGGHSFLNILLQSFETKSTVNIKFPQDSDFLFDIQSIKLNPLQKLNVKLAYCPKVLGVHKKNLFVNIQGFKVKLLFVGFCEMNNNKTIELPKLPAITQKTLFTQKLLKQEQRSISLLNLNHSALEKSKSLLLPVIEKTSNPHISRETKIALQQTNYLSKIAVLEKSVEEDVQGKKIFGFQIEKEKQNDHSTKQVKQIKRPNIKFQPDPKRKIEELSSVPKSHEESKQITQNLDPEKLMSIQVGPVELNFGQIFVNSTSSLYFQVKNDLLTSISVMIDYEDHFDLKESYRKPQIIPGGKTAGFRVTICPSDIRVFQQAVKYIINSQYIFQFLVKATIIPIDLILNRNSLLFKFRDDSNDIMTSEILTIRNPGNCPARFTTSVPVGSSFSFTKNEGVIAENSSKDIEVFYTAKSFKEEDVLGISIENGMNKTLKVMGVCNETSIELIVSSINLGSLAVSDKKCAFFSFRNTHKKNLLIFKIMEETLPEGLSLLGTSGKVYSENVYKLELEFLLSKRADYKNHEIFMIVRGLGIIKLYFTACVVIPSIEIEQKQFNFEKVTLSTKVETPLTILNESKITAEVYLDLSSNNPFLQEKYDCIEIEPSTGASNDSLIFEQKKGSAISSMRQQLKNTPKNNQTQINLSNIKEETYEDENLYENNTNQGKHYVFHLKPGARIEFLLRFLPLKPIKYEFELKFVLPGQEIEGSLIRKVIATGVTPTFILTPVNRLLDFDKKTVYFNESPPAYIKNFLLKNPSHVRDLIWNIKNLKENGENEAFIVLNSSGVTEPKMESNLQFEFRPLKPGNYEQKFELVFEDDESNSVEITLKGQAAYPSILFSKEEILLTPVPLGITTLSYLELFNDGYQNSNISLKIPSDIQKLGLSVDFKDNTMIGVANPKLGLKIAFVSQIPISFTVRLQIEDDYQRTYIVLISGSTDNCSLSYAPYLKFGQYFEYVFNRLLIQETNEKVFFALDTLKKISLNQSSGLHQIEEDYILMDSTSEILSRQVTYNSKKSTKIEEKVQKIQSYFVDLSNYIVNWLNDYGFSTITRFPDDLISSNGFILYDFLEFLVKVPFSKPTIDKSTKIGEQNKSLINWYITVITFLKENNAMVNIIRPYFLLSHRDFQIYMKSNRGTSINVINEYFQLSENEYRLISIITWSNLFLQIIKIFFLGKITINDLKEAIKPLINENSNNQNIVQQPNINNKQTVITKEMQIVNSPLKIKRGSYEMDFQNNESFQNIPKKTFQVQNLNFAQISKDLSAIKNPCYSVAELLIMKWIEFCYESRSGKIFKVTNFGKDTTSMELLAMISELYIGVETKMVEKVRIKLLNEEQKSSFTIIKNLLLDFGVKSEFEYDEFLKENHIYGLFLFMHLFKILPNYLPKSTIEFECGLHEKIQKDIVLNSSSGKMIIYSIKLFGDPNFGTSVDLVKIEGKENISVPVTFHAQTSLPVDGKILFQNHRNGKTVAAAVAFNLKAKVTSRTSSKIFNINNGYLYEISSTDISIKNPFDKNVDFKVTLENLLTSTASQTVSSTQTKVKGKRSTTQIGTGIKIQRPPVFFIKTEKLSIRKGATGKITIFYLPLFLESQKANLILLDPKVGEVQYELVGNPLIPGSSQDFTLIKNFEQYGPFDISIPLRNNSFFQAIQRILERLKEFKAAEYQEMFESLQFQQESDFKIEIEHNEILSITNNTVHLNSNKGKKNVMSKRPSQINSEEFVVSFVPQKKLPMKELSLEFWIRGFNGFDHRAFNLILTVNPKPVRGVLEMNTTARVPINQLIPVINQQPFECNLTFSLVPILNEQYFEVSTTPVIIKKESQFNLSVKFFSTWTVKAECRILINNSTTNEIFEYHVKACSEEPLSEDNVQIKTKAKNLTEIVLMITNPMPDNKSYMVETDFNDAKFQREIFFESKDPISFHLSFTPMIGGTFLNSINFIDKQGRFFWYVVTTEVDSPDSVKILRIQNEIRKPMIFKIELPSVNQVSHFKTIFVGNYLSGDEEFTLKPNESSSFDLIYFPLQIENSRKRVGFLSEEAGEIWFDVDCKSEESKVIRINTLKAQLGKSIQTSVVLYNPLKSSSTFVELQPYENSLFTVDVSRFDLGPSMEREIFITYTPNDLSKSDSELLVFKSDLIGDWKFQISGTGVEPLPFEPIQFSSSIGQSISKTLFFKNPLSKDTLLNLVMDGDKLYKDAFEIISPRQKNILLQGGAMIQIIVRFCPQKIKNYKINLLLKLTENVAWCYPLRGTTETVVSQEEHHIKTKCSTEISSIIDFDLQGADDNIIVDDSSNFEYKLILQCKQREVFEKWITVEQQIDTKESKIIKFKFTFIPLKAFKSHAEFIIIKPSGGQWKYKLLFESLEPDFFDTLTIYSKLNCRKTMQFRLFNNDKKNSSPFIAYFSNESDPEFFVSPNKGIVEPPIKDGSIFEVSYLPTQYGKEKKGVLIIETENFMWRLLVKGRFEKYIPPKKH